VAAEDIYAKHTYVLFEKNTPRGKVYDGVTGVLVEEQQYKPSLNVLMDSSIIWKGEIDPFSNKQRAAGKYPIRYYDGCTTLFKDDQPKDKETIDQFISSTRSVQFIFGHLEIYGYDTMLKTYLDWCSYNENSIYRVPTVAIKFKKIDTEAQYESEAEKLELEDTANDKAKGATAKKMRIHAKYLNIQMEDLYTNNPLTEKQLRVNYRNYAKKNAKHFLATFDDKSLEIKTWVRDAVNTGKLDLVTKPNSASWTSTGAIICSIGNIKDTKLAVDKLSEFAETDGGGDFLEQLRSIYG
jgi:hypothetical protein